MRTSTLHKLSSKAARSAGEGMHSDGGGLFLRVKNGQRSWVFRFTSGARKREMGLGPAASVGLADARRLAGEARAAVAQGRDPIAERDKSRTSPSPEPAPELTFREAADEFLRGYGPTLTNPKHRRQWWSSLDTYAGPLMPMSCRNIRAADVHACLSPIWLEKMETASRVRQRIERVLAWADAQEDRDRQNPADMRGKLGFLLPPQARVRIRSHHAAVPVVDASEAFARLWAKREAGAGYRAVVALVLSALRSGEIRRLEWDDIERDVIRIPAARMKARRDHVLPLTTILAAHIETQPRWEDSPLVFPGQGGRPMSDMTIAQAMRRTGLGDYTPNGWRSTFRDWAGQQGCARELAEYQMAHSVGSATERAYARDTLVEARRPMMVAWEEFLGGDSGVPA